MPVRNVAPLVAGDAQLPRCEGAGRGGRYDLGLAPVRLTVVGCSGSFPGPESAASCYLVEADDDDGRTWRVLLDLGSGALGPLQRYTSLYDVDAVLLSHLHPDHCLDLTGLYVALKYRPAGPAPAAAGLRPEPHGRAAAAGLRRPAGDRDERRARRPRVAPREPVPDRPVHRDAVPGRAPVEAYGMRVEADGAVLAYTGDTDASPR